jgi:hypothetical protein
VRLHHLRYHLSFHVLDEVRSEWLQDSDLDLFCRKKHRGALHEAIVDLAIVRLQVRSQSGFVLVV